MIQQIKREADFEYILSASQERPVFLFKHSTACGISSRAWREFQQFTARESEAEYWVVLAIEDRALSRAIAKQTGIRHQSPQVLLFHQGEVVWNESHFSIREKALEAALQTISGVSSADAR